MDANSATQTRAKALEAVKAKAEKRNLISAFFVTALISLAFQEMVPPVRESVRDSGLSFSGLALPIIFFLTAMRFFIGNYLHLQNEKMIMVIGYVWIYDLIFITLQSIILIFIAGLTSVKSSNEAYVSFSTLLIILYIVDILWILSQFLFRGSWKRDPVPWPWAALNSGIIVAMLLVRWIFGSAYTGTTLSFIVAINGLGFLLDLFLMDLYDAI